MIVYSYSRFVTARAILSVATVNSSLSSNCLLPVSDFKVYLVELGNLFTVPSTLKSASTIKLGGTICLLSLKFHNILSHSFFPQYHISVRQNHKLDNLVMATHQLYL